MNSLPDSLKEMARFYEIDSEMIEAVAERSPNAPREVDQHKHVRNWLKSLSAVQVRDLALQLITGDTAGVRADVLAQIRESSESVSWPVAQSTRTVADLYEAAAKLRLRSEELAREAAARRRAERLVQLAADPKKAVEHAAKLVAQRSTTDYELAAAELADLRDAMNSAAGDKLVTKAVASLIEKYPTLNNLKSSLRKRGLMPPR